MSHTIRLRAAWNRGRRRDDPQAAAHVALPDDSGSELDAAVDDAEIWYWRSFNCPSGLQSDTPLALIVHAWRGQLSLWLDDHPLAESGLPDAAPLRVDITGLLTASHRLTICLQDGRQAGRCRLNGIVTLEIG
ncbi:hypothetical protein SH139x_001434 [Planctomycetaceae bacterium SH139]